MPVSIELEQSRHIETELPQSNSPGASLTADVADACAQSTFAPESFTAFAHRGCSAAMNAANSAGA
jgi:hypothetical protein